MSCLLNEVNGKEMNEAWPLVIDDPQHEMLLFIGSITHLFRDRAAKQYKKSFENNRKLWNYY